MISLLRRMDRWLPQRLSSRLTLALMLIVVSAGLIITVVVNRVLTYHLRAELISSGEALTLALGEGLANDLVEADLVAVQESLNSAVIRNEDVLYAFAFGPSTPIIYTFPEGFPVDLLQTIPATDGLPGEGMLFRTENGFVRDFGYRPLDALDAEVHLGVSQERISLVQRQATTLIMGLTLVGSLVATAVAYGFARVITLPLVELTRRVQRLGQGELDECIDLPIGNEVGDLAAAFNQMALDIRSTMHHLQESEAGCRYLLTAAGNVGEGIALISDEGPQEGTFLFVNETFADMAQYRVKDLLGSNAAGVLHPKSLALARSSWEAIRSGDNPQDPNELVLIDRSGRPLFLETTGTMIEYQGQRALAWFTRNIGERKARIEELHRRNRELMAMNAVASAVSEPLPAAEMLERALIRVLNALQLDAGWIFIFEANESKPKLVACHGVDCEGDSLSIPGCPCEAVLADGESLVVRGKVLACDSISAQDSNAPPMVCRAVVQLRTRGEMLGVMSVASAHPGEFDQDELSLLSSLGQQISVALENARLWEELRRKEQVRGMLLDRIIRAQEDERQRIARELHDGIGQSLNALVFGFNAINAAWEQDLQVASGLLEGLKISTSDTIRELQNIIYDLRPSLLDDLGLVRAVHWYAQERLATHGVQVTLDVPESVRRLPPDVETALFRITQEAITNINKHARARSVQIKIYPVSDWIQMEIVDDGVGFVSAVGMDVHQDGYGWGLLGIRERAVLLGGEVFVESEPGRGTRLRISLPILEDSIDTDSNRR